MLSSFPGAALGQDARPAGDDLVDQAAGPVVNGAVDVPRHRLDLGVAGPRGEAVRFLPIPALGLALWTLRLRADSSAGAASPTRSADDSVSVQYP